MKIDEYLYHCGLNTVQYLLYQNIGKYLLNDIDISFQPFKGKRRAPHRNILLQHSASARPGWWPAMPRASKRKLFKVRAKQKKKKSHRTSGMSFPVYPLLDIYVQTYGIESVNFWCSKNLVHLTSYYIDKET